MDEDQQRQEDEDVNLNSKTQTQEFEDTSSSYLGYELKYGTKNEIYSLESTLQYDETLPLENDTTLFDDTLPLQFEYSSDTQLVDEKIDDADGETQVIEIQDPVSINHGNNEFEDFHLINGIHNATIHEINDNHNGNADRMLSSNDCGDILSDADCCVLEKGAKYDICDGKNKQHIPSMNSFNLQTNDILLSHNASVNEDCFSGNLCSPTSLLCQDATKKKIGSMQRTFTSIRVASLRSSGFASAQNLTRKEEIVNEPNSSVCFSQLEQSKQNALLLHSENETIVSENPTIACRKENKEIEREDMFVGKNEVRLENTTVRKLFQDPLPYVNKEEMKSTGSDHGIVGLSYVSSQEPCELSQTNALDVVEKILSIDDIDFSDKSKMGNKPKEKTPPSSSVKGRQFLAKHASHQDPIENEEIFDWIDSREDESGGNFFTKRKELFFNRSDSVCKSFLQMQNQSTSTIKRNVIKEFELREDQNHKRASSVTCLKLNLSFDGSADNTKIISLDPKVQKNRVKNMEQELNQEDFDRYDVGPDTQLAAEAMEALMCAHPTESTTRENLCPEVKSKKKRSSVMANSDRITRIKRMNIVDTKSKTKFPFSSDVPLMQIQMLKDSCKKKSKECLSDKSEQIISKLSTDASFIKGMKQNNIQASVTPIAQRTRHSMKLKTSIESKTLHCKRKLQVEGSKNDKIVDKSNFLMNTKKKENQDILANSSNAIVTLPASNVPSSMQLSKLQNGCDSDGLIATNKITGSYSSRKHRTLTSKNTRKSNSWFSANHSSIAISDIKIPTEGQTESLGISGTRSNEKYVVWEPHSVSSPKIKSKQLVSICATPSNSSNAVSPIFASDSHQNSSMRSASRRSLARELAGLEAKGQLPNTMWKDFRRRRDVTSFRVLFSHHLDDDTMKQQKKVLARLGISEAESSSDATHFVADKFVRTRNMLESMALGKPVVTHLWLESCGQAGCFIDERNYLLRDLKKEREIGFTMPVSLARANKKSLLQDKRIFITPNVIPDRELIVSLVKAASGQAIQRMGRSATKNHKIPEDLLVISCEEDYSICVPLLEKGAEVYSSELLLNGIVIQKLEYDRHRLFMDHVRTRSTVWMRSQDGNQFVPINRHS